MAKLSLRNYAKVALSALVLHAGVPELNAISPRDLHKFRKEEKIIFPSDKTDKPISYMKRGDRHVFNVKQYLPGCEQNPNVDAYVKELHEQYPGAVFVEYYSDKQRSFLNTIDDKMKLWYKDQALAEEAEKEDKKAPEKKISDGEMCRFFNQWKDSLDSCDDYFIKKVANLPSNVKYVITVSHLGNNIKGNKVIMKNDNNEKMWNHRNYIDVTSDTHYVDKFDLHNQIKTFDDMNGKAFRYGLVSWTGLY